jgi:hypothetical protein
MLERWMTAAASAAALLVLTACGASAEDICDAACDCAGDSCSDAEHADCLEEFEEEEAQAEETGCTDEYEEVIDCYDEKATCKDGRYDFADDACGEAVDAYDNCT